MTRRTDPSSFFPPYILKEPDPYLETPVVIDSPHSGRVYPGDFNCVAPFRRLRRAEDAYVDELVDFAPELGATLLHALFPRSYVDVNRSLAHVNPRMIDGAWPHEVDTSAAVLSRGLGLFWENIGNDTPLYDRRLPIDEVTLRVERYYKPYRQALDEVIDRKLKKFGRVLYIDMHSMSADGSIAVESTAVVRPDYYLGDLFHRSIDRSVTYGAKEFLEQRGRSVGVNDYFSGGDLIVQHGKPDTGRHALMIEINRGNYLHEVAVEKSEGFEGVRSDLRALVSKLSTDFQET